jgi:hypothetical protein
MVLDLGRIGRGQPALRRRRDRLAAVEVLLLLLLSKRRCHALTAGPAAHLLQLAQLIDRIASTATSAIEGRARVGSPPLLGLGVEQDLEVVAFLPSRRLSRRQRRVVVQGAIATHAWRVERRTAGGSLVLLVGEGRRGRPAPLLVLMLLQLRRQASGRTTAERQGREVEMGLGLRRRHVRARVRGLRRLQVD